MHSENGESIVYKYTGRTNDNAFVPPAPSFSDSLTIDTASTLPEFASGSAGLTSYFTNQNTKSRLQMAAFKGGPALPKRFEKMTPSSATIAADTSGGPPCNKRKQRTTALLSNRCNTDDKEEVARQISLMHGANKQADDGDTSTIAGTSEDDESIVKHQHSKTYDHDDSVAIPTSSVRSTAVDNDTDDDDIELSTVKTRRPRKAMKSDPAREAEEFKLFKAESSTPKSPGSRTNAAAGSSKDVIKTPPKKQATSASATPNRSGEPASVSAQSRRTQCPRAAMLILLSFALLSGRNLGLDARSLGRSQLCHSQGRSRPRECTLFHDSLVLLSSPPVADRR